MPKDYQNNKERLQKKLVKDIIVFLKKKKKKGNNMVKYDTNIYQNMKSKSYSNIAKILKNEKKKTLYNNYEKLFLFRKSGLLSASIFKRV